MPRKNIPDRPRGDTYGSLLLPTHAHFLLTYATLCFLSLFPNHVRKNLSYTKSIYKYGSPSFSFYCPIQAEFSRPANPHLRDLSNENCGLLGLASYDSENAGRFGGICNLHLDRQRVRQARNQQTEAPRRDHLSACFCWFLVWFTLRLWWRRRYVPLKRWALSELHNVTTQKSVLFIVTITRTSNPILSNVQGLFFRLNF
jgi:hypothetical protein